MESKYYTDFKYKKKGCAEYDSCFYSKRTDI